MHVKGWHCATGLQEPHPRWFEPHTFTSEHGWDFTPPPHLLLLLLSVSRSPSHTKSPPTPTPTPKYHLLL